MLSLVLALVRWDDIARYLRGELLRIRSTYYIQAAQTAGLAPAKIIVKYLLPNALAPVLFIVAITMSWTILLESSFSFLGIATTRDSISWGKMLAYGREFFPAWWLTLFPGLMIFLCVLALNVLADAITEALDSRERVQ
jgi:ABC-type dipeptide/oligopeptide/nickel transport system permease subunit